MAHKSVLRFRTLKSNTCDTRKKLLLAVRLFNDRGREAVVNEYARC